MRQVLVLQDTREAAALVRHHLESEGLAAFVATDSADAWKMLVSKVPDAAIIEVHLQGDGWGLLAKIREDGRFHRMPIVVLSRAVDPVMADRAESLGCAYLQRPFSASALVERLGMAERRAADIKERERRVQLNAVDVVVMLGEYRIEGRVHLAWELDRFSESWEALMHDDRAFVPMTQASLTTTDGSRTLATAAFIEVRKEDIRAVFPMMSENPAET